MSNLIASDGQYTGKYTTNAGTISGGAGVVDLTSADFYDVASSVEGTKLPDGLVFTSITVEATHGTQSVLIGYGAKGNRSSEANMLVTRPLTVAYWPIRGQVVGGSPVTKIGRAHV